MAVTTERRVIPDPVSGTPVEMLYLRAGRTEAVAVPGRCMDLYEVWFDGVQVSLTDRRAAILDPSYECRGAESFSRSFFAGMLTTCGLIQAGRPCEEDGRSFGLHGWISHIPAAEWELKETGEEILLTARTEESHPEGERLLLERTYRVRDAGISWRDRVTNLGKDTPFMMMYHINFGAPFLSERLKLDVSFASEEDRDTGLPAGADAILRMEGPRAGRAEKVYYTRPESRRAVLESGDTGVRAELRFDGFDWMGVWKNFDPDKYGLGLEPCMCPGLGRAGARKRNLLPALARGESHESGAELLFER